MGQVQAANRRCNNTNLEEHSSPLRKTAPKPAVFVRPPFFRRLVRSPFQKSYKRLWLVTLAAVCITALVVVSWPSSAAGLTDDESVFAPITMRKVASKWRGYLSLSTESPQAGQLQLYYPRHCGHVKSCAIIMPTFIVAGGEHSGTSYVFNTLRLHPQVVGAVDHQRVAKRKAGTQESITNDDPLASFEEYLTEFPMMHDGIRAVLEQRGKVVVGEHAPQYLYKSHVTAHRLRELLPQVKLVFILRDPVDRAFTQYHKGIDHNVSFESLVDRELSVIRQCCHTTTSWEGFIRCHDSSEIRAARQGKSTSQDALVSDTLARGMYYSALLPFLEQFPAAQLFVMRTEDFLDNPSASFQRLARFLGIDESYFSERNFYHAQRMDDAEPMDDQEPGNELLEHDTYHEQINRPGRVTAMALKENLEEDDWDKPQHPPKDSETLQDDPLTVFDDAHSLDLGTRYRLQNVFRQLNAQLMELFGKTDFKGWDYDVDIG